MKTQTKGLKKIFANSSIREELAPYINNQILGHSSGQIPVVEDGAEGTLLRSALIKGKMTVTLSGDNMPDKIVPTTPAFIKICGMNLMPMTVIPEKTAAGLTVSCDGETIRLSGSCTGLNSGLVTLAKNDAQETLHIEVLSGSCQNGGMYFPKGVWLGFKTQRYIYTPDCGTAIWKNSPWITDDTVLSDNFSMRIWMTPGVSPEIPYEKYRETRFELPENIVLYATPDNAYQDTFDAATGILTNKCGIELLKYGSVSEYSPAAGIVDWVTSSAYVPNAACYTVVDGKVDDTAAADWAGKIKFTLDKTALGILETDSQEQAAAKIAAYFGDSYIIAPLKTPVIEQLSPVEIPLPKEKSTIFSDQGDIELEYCKNINTAYLTLESRVSELENLLSTQ